MKFWIGNLWEEHLSEAVAGPPRMGLEGQALSDT